MPTAEPSPATLSAATPGDLDALLPLLGRFAASQGYAFEPAQARAALSALLTRPELSRVYLIVHGGVRVGYAALPFGWSLEWGGRDAFVDELFVEEAHRARGHGRAAVRALSASVRSTSRWRRAMRPGRRSTARRASPAASGGSSPGG